MNEGLVSEDVTSASISTVTGMDADGLISAGQLLRQARVHAGVEIIVLAITLKVPVKRLEALENDDMGLLPDIVFVRALASSICSTLKVDAGPILDRLPKVSSMVLNSSDGAIAAFNRPIRMVAPASKVHLLELYKAPWVMGVISLLVGTASIYLWPKPLSSAGLDVAVATSLLPASMKPVVPQDANESRKMLINTAHYVDEQSAVKEPVKANEQSQEIDNSNKFNSGESLVNTAKAAVPLSSIVVFKATGQTWVEVKSVNGITILKKLLNSGEIAGATGTLPLTVIVGRADMTQVEVRGKEVDLALIAKSNVARFEVN